MPESLESSTQAVPLKTTSVHRMWLAEKIMSGKRSPQPKGRALLTPLKARTDKQEIPPPRRIPSSLTLTYRRFLNSSGKTSRFSNLLIPTNTLNLVLK